MGYFAPEPVIGGLDDEQCATSRPASFGAISSQAMPTIPLGLQHNRNQGNKVRPSLPPCNGHYNRPPDLGKCVRWWNAWDLAKLSILDA